MHKKIRTLKTLRAVRAFNACADCGTMLVARSGEYLCPKCGLVTQMIDGAV